MPGQSAPAIAANLPTGVPNMKQNADFVITRTLDFAKTCTMMHIKIDDPRIKVV
jgi:hypothetical protein